MKQILLRRIELTNFKGIAHRIEKFANGENFINGINGSGKTSIFDAFVWCLFGKDSQGQSEEKAKIKMLGKDGKPLMHTDNSVEIVLDVDGTELILRRTYKEKWRKPSGQAEQVYDGQKTEFSWNGNEKISATEYKKRVNDLLDEGLFKLITDPLYFASLDVKERRNIVLAMAGEVPDDVIRSSSVELKDFDPSDDIEEKRDVAMSTKNRLVKDRDNYPARIDEQMQLITRKEQELSDMILPNKDELNAERLSKYDAIKAIDDKLTNASKLVNEVARANKERLDMLREAESYKAKKQREADASVEKYNKANRELLQRIEQLQADITGLDYRIENGNKTLDGEKARLKEIQNAIDKIYEEPIPDLEIITFCPMCNRPLDTSDIELKKEKMSENWMSDQKNRINSLTDKGNQIFESAKTYKGALDDLYKQRKDKCKELDSLKTQVKDDLPYVQIDFSTDEVYLEMISAIPDEVLEDEEIAHQSEALNAEKVRHNERIREIDLQLNMYITADILKGDIKNARARIEALETERLKVNQGIADQEKIIYLCDLWLKKKVNLLNEAVSSKFGFVKFKMFNYTQEGNARPTCEITVDGVDYTALNTASKMNAGLDIINALIDHYDVKAPIFIDNRESVTNIKAPNTQIINLVVTGGNA